MGVEYHALGSKEVKEFSQIVNQANDLHPFWFPVTADSLGGLKQMLYLSELCLNIQDETNTRQSVVRSRTLAVTYK